MPKFVMLEYFKIHLHQCLILIQICIVKDKDYRNYSYAVRPTSQPSFFGGGKSLEDLIKSLSMSTAQFQQSTAQFQLEMKTSIRNLENQMYLLASAMSQLTSQNFETLHSKTIVNSEPDMSAIILRSGEKLQEIQREESSYVVEEKVEKEAIGSQPLTSPVKKSNKEIPTMVTSPSSLTLISHFIFSIGEIDFVIPEIFEFHDREKLGVARLLGY